MEIHLTNIKDKDYATMLGSTINAIKEHGYNAHILSCESDDKAEKRSIILEIINKD